MSRSGSKENGKRGMTVFWGNICYICSHVCSIACILGWMLGGVARVGFEEHGICCQYQLEQPWCWRVIIPSGGLGPISYHLHLGTKQHGINRRDMGGIIRKMSE